MSFGWLHLETARSSPQARGGVWKACQIDTLDTLIGKDGKEYPRNIKQPKQEEGIDIDDHSSPT